MQKRTEIKEWARRNGMPYTTVLDRIKRGKIRAEKGFKVIEKKVRTTYILED